MNKVLLTIDTEGPRGSDPVLYQIWGKVGDEYYGIPKIIEICDKYGAKGLFFVDIPEIYDYGYDKVCEVVEYIIEKGHDVGVHIHPHHCPNETRHFLFDYSYEEQYEIIKNCTDAFEKMAGRKPASFRAGKYGANHDTLRILNELGYKYDFSEYYSQKWCGIDPPVGYIRPEAYEGLVEFPVTVFKSLSLGSLYSRYDKLEATDNPKEIMHIMKRYAKKPYDGVIILFLHSFSFVNFLNTPDAPTLNEKHLSSFEKVMKFVYQSSVLEFVSAADLCEAELCEKGSVADIVKTRGLFRQVIYSFVRLAGIKENKKAKLLMTFLVCAAIGLLVLVVLLCILIWRLLI